MRPTTATEAGEWPGKGSGYVWKVDQKVDRLTMAYFLLFKHKMLRH
jgi:hypothetical protein